MASAQPGDEVINGIPNDSSWHLLADDIFSGDEGSTAQPARQVGTLLDNALATLGLPVALIQAISTRVIQAVTHSSRISPSTPVSIRVYTQKLDDPASDPGGTGWGFFLVERSVNRPGDPTEAADYLIEIYLYTEGEAQ